MQALSVVRSAKCHRLIEDFMKSRLSSGTFISCKPLGARLHWRECAKRHRRKRMIRSFGRKLEQFATPQDKKCQQCRRGATMAARLAREKKARIARSWGEKPPKPKLKSKKLKLKVRRSIKGRRR